MRISVAVTAGLLMVASAAPVTVEGSRRAGVRAAEGRSDLKIVVLSNRADLLSGGDALVEIVLPAEADVSTLVVQLAMGEMKRDVTGAFVRRSNGRVLGMVTGLPAGDSALLASLTTGNRNVARIKLTNYP